MNRNWQPYLPSAAMRFVAFCFLCAFVACNGEPRDADSPIIDTDDRTLHDSLVVIVAVLSNESYTTDDESHQEPAEPLQGEDEDALLVDLWCPVYYEALLHHPLADQWTTTFGGAGVRREGIEKLTIANEHPCGESGDACVGTAIETLECRRNDTVRRPSADEEHNEDELAQPRCSHRVDEASTRSRTRSRAFTVFKSWSSHSLALAPVYSVLARNFPEVDFVALDVHRMCSRRRTDCLKLLMMSLADACAFIDDVIVVYDSFSLRTLGFKKISTNTTRRSLTEFFMNLTGLEPVQDDTETTADHWLQPTQLLDTTSVSAHTIAMCTLFFVVTAAFFVATYHAFVAACVANIAFL